MSLSPEKVAELKQIIRTQATQMQLQSHIREVMSDSLQEASRSDGSINDAELFEGLRRKGVLDEIMQKIQFDSGSRGGFRATGENGISSKPATHFVDNDARLVKTASSVQKANVDPTRRYLYLQVLGGRAFLEHLQEPEPLSGHLVSTFTVHVHFRGQRFKSKPTACACEPDIQEGFLLELHKSGAGDAPKMIDNTAMLAISDPVHLVLVKTDTAGETSLVTSHYLDWRPVIAAPNSRCTLSLEIMGVGSENKVPVGLLDVRLELIPRTQDTLTEDVISAQTSLEKGKRAERERLFLIYAKQWWKEYLQIRQSHKDRLVKIFAQDENAMNRPVCSYVKPLRAGRLLDTPRQAARFVSLIGYEKASSVGGGERAEQWASMHAFLCRNKGDCEDHALLLCSLLLGFGLDAYVCVGTKSKGASHTWVMTQTTDGDVTFWESLNGHRYAHCALNPNNPPADQQPKPKHPYKTVGCVFNHQTFYANSQVYDTVELCQFSLSDESKWKAMSTDAIHSVCGTGMAPGWPSLPPLCGSSLDAALISNDIERELRALVMEHRRDQGRNTNWDDHLSYLLTPALSAYEMERVAGITTGNEEFQDAIRRAVPDGHTFKGYPVQFVHRNARRAFAACLKSPVCAEIINCSGDVVKLAVRVRVFSYPESACATWLMFACKYKCLL